jgi:carboxyl-terminal processing protease
MPPASPSPLPERCGSPRSARGRSGVYRPTPRLAAAGLALLVAAAATGCGGSGSPETGQASALPAPAPAAPTEAAWARSVMEQTYLYADRMPRVALPDDASAAQVLEALRVDPPDRFSYVDRADRYAAYFEDGRTVGLGIVYSVLGDALVLRGVQPASPAARAGLQRGDRIVAIDGRDTTQLVDAGTVGTALGEAIDGLTVRLTIERGGQRADYAVIKAPYAVAPVLATRVLSEPTGPVGYVALYTFTEPARVAWAEAISTVRQAGATRLVVDLRDNGGGRLDVAAAIAATLAPPAAAGQAFVDLRHAPRRAALDRGVPLASAPPAGFEQVAWIVSEASCSAAEALIAGLRPYRSDPVIGSRTCGKPVGFDPQVRGDVVLNAVTFSMRNRDGWTDWFDGISPTCVITDEPWLPLGDPADPRLAGALQFLSTGRCPTAPATATAKADPRDAARPERFGGLVSETGLW